MSASLTSVLVSCPATSANLGPGFDVLGVALARRNRFRIEACERFELSASGLGAERVPTLPEEHLVVSAYQAARAAMGLAPVSGLRVHVEVEVPPSRGLGSSATASVAGILGAEALSGQRLSEAERLRLATRLEGHPDNVVPCLLGGICAAVAEGEAIHTLRLAPPAPPEFVVVIPTSLELSTETMRAALPAEVRHEDAVFSLGRAALLVGALASGQDGLLRVALDDRLHQPYRGPHLPGFVELIAVAQGAGAHGLVISGSGPTLLALTPPGSGAAVARALQSAWTERGVDCLAEPLALAEGASIEPS